MFGSHPRLSQWESRKQLLIAESDLNREHLTEDLVAVMAGVHALTGRAKSLGSMASSAAIVMAGLAALRHAKSAAGNVHRSWLNTIFKGAGMASTLWLAFRARGSEPPGK